MRRPSDSPLARFSQNKLCALIISSAVRNGEVGCKSVIVSYSHPISEYLQNTSLTASHEEAVSDEVYALLRNGTCAPNFFAISPYSSESVESITVSKSRESKAAFIVYPIRGIPANSLIFLSLRPFEPDLAGIIARFFIK